MTQSARQWFRAAPCFWMSLFKLRSPRFSLVGVYVSPFGFGLEWIKRMILGVERSEMGQLFIVVAWGDGDSFGDLHCVFEVL
ncbi:MAG: hypothetical protein ACFCU8_19705 [Thermosynechococcaceae cyanobacterium]